MALQKCVHKGCNKTFLDPAESDCVHHPGPPVFHEGQKGWKCCKPRVLSFDEFLEIPPCTKGQHSAVDDTPAEEKAAPPAEAADVPSAPAPQPRPPQPTTTTPSVPAPPPPESESDDPSDPVPPGTACRRRACGASYNPSSPRDAEECVYHPGAALFHEGTKGWTCCKPRSLEFDEFMRIPGCRTKARHLFLGSKKAKKASTTDGGEAEETIGSVRTDFYQTPNTVIASVYLKKVDAARAHVSFAPHSLTLDLPTLDGRRYRAEWPLYGAIDAETSIHKVLGTKVELAITKADGAGWPVLRSDERRGGEIIQAGAAGRA
ncbi:MAG: hypothetical protein M1832_004844 [Thelocarpon impressellum]|nr:MAG: hypothetical protein M1832_004844 [Thelocarpon impressellum]